MTSGALRHLGRHRHTKLPARARQRNALIERMTVLIAQVIEDPGKVTRVLAQLAELFLELVDFFDHEDG